MNKISFIVAVLFALAGCRSVKQDIEPALRGISAETMKSYISVLASDDFLGRAPSSAGEEKTISYLSEQFRLAGLEPVSGESYFQEVPLVKITPDPSMKLNITGGKRVVSLNFSTDFIGGTPQTDDLINLSGSEMIFAGYGIYSPDDEWNDYEGVDVKGKTVVMLVNDPGYATEDPELFTGRAMTYFGRWTYKYEEAARQGATACIIIHETGAAAYPWGVVQNSWSGPQFYLEDNPLTASPLQFKGWVTLDAAHRIFESAGLDLDLLSKAASVRGFRPVNMNLKASLQFTNQVEYTTSNNVAGVLPGRERADEYVIYTAHWDHFGVNNSFEGDTILNGAVDNATGVAALIELAHAFGRLPERQDRSILFLSVTCEEQGLLGSEYYARHPLFPPEKTVGVINIDAMNILGPTRDMNIAGYGYSELDDYAVAVLERHDRYATGDPSPEKGGYFRSDHFSFAKEGIPSLNLSSGVDNRVHGKEWGMAKTAQWTMENYHKPSDNYEPDKWNFDGMIEDTGIYFELGYDLSMTDSFPGWKEGFPFKALRDEMMKR